MSSVFYDSAFNSTFFTTCCRVAITDSEQKCPRCREDVTPFFPQMSDEERDQAAGGYYNHNTRMARMSAAKGSW